MAEEILINVMSREVRAALIDQGVLQEIHIERTFQQGVLGNIYKGKVNRLLPGIQAAFIDIGNKKSAFLHLNELQEEGLDIPIQLQPGQNILVQVFKDPLGSKVARVTTHFTLASRYLVFIPKRSTVAVSQKIDNEPERERLMAMITPNSEGGYIFRTAAQGITQKEVDADKYFLDTLWQTILERVKTTAPGQLVYEEIPMVQRILRDMVGSETKRIRVDHAGVAGTLREFSKRYVSRLYDRIEFYADKKPILDLYAIEDQLQKALQRKVYLKSGGYLIFDQTEAMTTIDVNTGSYVGQGNVEETLFATNIEAIGMIAQHIRLRNLGGIIIIDFIDMADTAHRIYLLKLLTMALAKDNVRIDISELSSLGLVQLTRKRTRDSLEHILCVPCPLCHCRGSVKSLETIAYDIFRSLQRVAQHSLWSGFTIRAAEQVINYLLTEEALMLAVHETKLGKPINLKIGPSYTQEHYNILSLSEEDRQ